MPIKIKKASGEYELFSEEKVRSSLQRAGAKGDLADQVLARLKGKLYEGITTREIYSQVFRLLEKTKGPLVAKYNLKRAIMQLGPSGYPFEKFVAGLLESEGYRVEVGRVVRGKCISHELDVIAQKGNRHFMIECKFHNRPGIKSDVRTALYTQARFLDVEKAWVEIANHRQKFHQGWLVTNTKVTSAVRLYARCVGLKVISWDYPAGASLRFLIEKSGLHPITCLRALSQGAKRRLLEKGIVFCRDLLGKELDFLPPAVVKRARKEALGVCES